MVTTLEAVKELDNEWIVRGAHDPTFCLDVLRLVLSSQLPLVHGLDRIEIAGGNLSSEKHTTVRAPGNGLQELEVANAGASDLTRFSHHHQTFGSGRLEESKALVDGLRVKRKERVIHRRGGCRCDRPPQWGTNRGGSRGPRDSSSFPSDSQRRRGPGSRPRASGGPRECSPKYLEKDTIRTYLCFC